MHPNIVYIAIFFTLCSICGCERDTAFHRDMDFNADWVLKDSLSGCTSQVCYSKFFDLNLDEEAIYMLQVTSDKPYVLKTNNNIVPKIEAANSVCSYNITSCLKNNKNVMEMTFVAPEGFDFSKNININLSKLRKLYISDLQSVLNNDNTKSLDLDIRVYYVSAFKEEKQGVLEIHVNDLQGKEMASFKTPVFPKANSKNMYVRKISVDTSNINIAGNTLNVSCELSSLDEVVDCVYQTIVLE